MKTPTPWFFVTGTDTGVGKTTVSTALLQLANKFNIKSLGIKPVAAGCDLKNNVWVNDDGLKLLEASNYSSSYHDVNPVAFSSAGWDQIECLST